MFDNKARNMQRHLLKQYVIDGIESLHLAREETVHELSFYFFYSVFRTFLLSTLFFFYFDVKTSTASY